MSAAEDKVIHNQFPSIEQRAAKAMTDYKVGIADEVAGKGRAIRAIVEYGRALQEGRNRDRSNRRFGQWVTDNGLDVGKPWDDRRERTAAMEIAKIPVDGTLPSTTFDACPYTTPTNVMKWYRKTLAPKTDEEPKRKSAADKAQSKGGDDLDDRAEFFDLKPHYKQAEIEELLDKKTPKKKIEEITGLSDRQVRHITERVRVERAAVARALSSGALTKAEADLSEKSKLTLADAIRIHKAKLDKAFEQLVSDEVKKRIAAANDAVRERLKKADQAILQFERDRGKRGVFSKRQFKQLQICCHPDASASKETRAELLQILVKYETYLVNPELKQ